MLESKVELEAEFGELPQLSLVTLTPGNKHRLLQNAIESSEKSMEESQALLGRLEQLDPSVARNFDFKNVAISDAPLRLLRPVPIWQKAINGLKKGAGRFGLKKEISNFVSVSSTSDKSFDSLVAVSYCWHSPDWTPAPVCQLSGGWPISQLMLSAIMAQTLYPWEGVWIDQLCIDQTNQTEKMNAIGSVDLVYKSARLIFVILEDVFLSTVESNEISNIENWSQSSNPRALSRASSLLLASRWWTRAWCAHEFHLSTNLVYFLFPTEDGLKQVNIRTLSTVDLVCHHYKIHTTTFPYHAFEAMFRSYSYRTIKYYRRTPLAQFNSIIGMNSSRETDKIGISLNIAGIQLYLVGPHMSVHQCRWILAMVALCAGDLSTLCGCADTIQLSTEAKEVSWLRWSIETENFVASLSPPTFLKSSDIMFMDSKHVTLDLLVFEHFSIFCASNSSILKAKTFLVQHAKDFVSEGWTKEDATTGKYQEHLRPLIDRLACCLDCGLSWIIENVTFNHDVAREMQWRIELRMRKVDLWPFVASLLIDAYPSEESSISNLADEKRQSMLQYLYFVVFNMFLSDMPSYYESGILEGSYRSCMRLDWGTSCGKGLTFVGTDKIPECRWAVPAALAGTTCATMDRVWLLRPRASPTDSEWSIIEKLKLVTLRPLEEDGKNLVLWAKQTIRG
jgi:Heterokaryon incompatibility protein (HET)